MATVKGIDILGVFNSLREDKKLVITDNVFDDVQGKFQDKINKEIIDKEAENRSVISRIKSEVEAFIGPETNYLGIVESTASLPTDKAPAWCLVADPDEGIAKVKVYVLPYGGTTWGMFTSKTYDFTDFTEVKENISYIYSALGMLEDTLDEKASVEISDRNDRLVETKVNALMDVVKFLVKNVVFHNGVPYSIPSALSSNLKLDAHLSKSFAYGITLPMKLN